MKNYLKYLMCVVMMSYAFCVGEAGAIFLLINPGAGPAGTGEAQVAKANDAYASYYNPAGLAFLEGSEMVLQHVNWLPNLADDIFYEFMGYRNHIKGLGTVGGHLIYLNLGEQTQTDELGNKKGLFKSYMMAFNGSFGTMVSQNSALGVNFKVFHQKLAESSVTNESGDPFSTDFAFDIGYLRKIGKKGKHQFGFNIQNIGPPIDFIDSQQADPAPTNMKFGIYTELFNDGVSSLHMLLDANKLLVGTYPAMDWNGDGIIFGEDEIPHSDKWYKGIITAWLDDWYYGGDYDLCEGQCLSLSDDSDLTVTSNLYGSYYRDNRIGGFYETRQDIVVNESIYKVINDVYNNFTYSLPNSQWEEIDGILWDGQNDYNNDGISNDEIPQNGFCNTGEDCTTILLTNIGSLSTYAFEWDNAEHNYPNYFNDFGYSCYDALTGVNDNPTIQGSNIAGADDVTDPCGISMRFEQGSEISDWYTFEWNTPSYQLGDFLVFDDSDGDGLDDSHSWCVDSDNNGYCDAVPYQDNLNFNGDNSIDCINDGNDFCIARVSGYCDEIEYIDQYGNVNTVGDDDNERCKDYYTLVDDDSLEDQFLIPIFSNNGGADFYFDETNFIPTVDAEGNPDWSSLDLSIPNGMNLTNYINTHTFGFDSLCSDNTGGEDDSSNGYCDFDQNGDGFVDTFDLPTKNFYDWKNENTQDIVFATNLNNTLTKSDNQIVYLPNYRGYCDEIYTPYERTVVSNGVMGKSHGYSLCYDQEGDSYYKPQNLGTFKDPKWEYVKNDAEFGQVAWIDIPHDGLGQFDKFDIGCYDKNNDGLPDDDAYFCSDGFNLGITEETLILNVNPIDFQPYTIDNIENCPEWGGINQNVCYEYVDENNAIWDQVDNDVNWVETNLAQGNIDLDGDGLVDEWAWFYNSDSDTEYNLRQPHHDISVDGSDQYSEGGYDFNHNKYGYYNAYGNYEKGSGDDRKFTDELEEMIYNFGFEYDYSQTFIMRVGFIYDLEGEVKNPTFGAGLKFDKYGFDFGYTAGDDDDARSETMFLSVSLGL